MPVSIKPLPALEYLQACFDYDPDSGIIRWQTRPHEHFSSDRAYSHHYFTYAGKQITNIEKGYLNLTLDGVHYRAARVIWKLVTWEEPPDIVDHIDRDKLNNRWTNLRAATAAQSIHNQKRKITTGIRKRGHKWHAQIYHNGIWHRIGAFDDAEQATAAYQNAARNMHGKFYAE